MRVKDLQGDEKDFYQVAHAYEGVKNALFDCDCDLRGVAQNFMFYKSKIRSGRADEIHAHAENNVVRAIKRKYGVDI